MDRGLEPHRVAGERARVELLHRAALALVHVHRVAAVAEGLGELVDHVRAGGRQRAGEVRAAPDQQVAGERRRRCAAPVEVARVHVDLVGEAGVEVADLRSADEQRMSRVRVLRIDHQLV